MKKSCKEIYYYIKQYYNLPTNQHLADFLKIPYNTLMSHLRNDSPDIDAIIDNAPDLSLDLLFKGVEFTSHFEALNYTIQKLKDEIYSKDLIISALTEKMKDMNKNDSSLNKQSNSNC